MTKKKATKRPAKAKATRTEDTRPQPPARFRLTTCLRADGTRYVVTDPTDSEGRAVTSYRTAGDSLDNWQEDAKRFANQRRKEALAKDTERRQRMINQGKITPATA